MGKGLGHRAAAWCVHTGLYIRAFIKWLLVAAVAGTPSAVYSTATGAAPTTAIL